MGGLDQLDGLDAVLCLCHHVHALLAVDQHPDAGAHDAVVVCDQDVEHQGTCRVTVVPSPGSERIFSSPPTSRARSAIPFRPSPLGRPLLWKPTPSSRTVRSTPAPRATRSTSTCAAREWRATFASASWATR